MGALGRDEEAGGPFNLMRGKGTGTSIWRQLGGSSCHGSSENDQRGEKQGVRQVLIILTLDQKLNVNCKKIGTCGLTSSCFEVLVVSP